MTWRSVHGASLRRDAYGRQASAIAGYDLFDLVRENGVEYHEPDLLDSGMGPPNDPQRLDPRRNRGAFRPSVHRARVPRGRGAPASITRRARCSFAPCCRSRPAAAPRTAAIARNRRTAKSGLKAEKLMDADAVLAAAARGESAWRRSASAWARRGASPRTATWASVCADGRGVKAMGLENLHDARHADRRSGAGALEGRRPRLLQPQHRHLARTLRRRSSPRGLSRSGSIRWRKCAARG